MNDSPDPASIPLKHWFHHYWQLRGTCRQCGRVATVHSGLLIRQYGDEARIYPGDFDRFASKIVCIRCGARQPKLEIVVERD